MTTIEPTASDDGARAHDSLASDETDTTVDTTTGETPLEDDSDAMSGAHGGLRSRTEDVLRDADRAVADVIARRNAFLARERDF